MYYFTLLEVGTEWVQIWVSVELGGPLLDKNPNKTKTLDLLTPKEMKLG